MTENFTKEYNQIVQKLFARLLLKKGISPSSGVSPDEMIGLMLWLTGMQRRHPLNEEEMNRVMNKVEEILFMFESKEKKGVEKNV